MTSNINTANHNRHKSLLAKCQIEITQNNFVNDEVHVGITCIAR